MKLTNANKAGLFKLLASKPLYSVGLEFGLDKYYKDTTAVKNAIYRIYREVLNDPEKFLIAADTVRLVQDAVSSRSIAQAPTQVLAEKIDSKADLKTIALDNRDHAARLVTAKLNMLGSSKKKLNEISLTALVTSFGILFDKGQIIQGEATENVAVLAKIDREMAPEDALLAVLKMREINNIEKAEK